MRKFCIKKVKVYGKKVTLKGITPKPKLVLPLPKLKGGK